MLLALTGPLVGSRATAAPDSAGLKVVLQGDRRGCLSERALSERIVHYFTDSTLPTRDFGIRVHERANGSTEFELERGGSAVAARTFPKLPEACADRVDALALALAIAMEQAESSPRGPTAPRPATPAAPPAQPPAADAPRSNEAEPPSAQASSTDPASSTHSGEDPPRSLGSGGPTKVGVQERVESRSTLAPGQEQARAPVSAGVGMHDAPTPEPRPIEKEKSTERYSIHAGGGVLLGVLPMPAGALFAGVDIPVKVLGIQVHARLSGLVSGLSRSQLVTGQVETQVASGRIGLCIRDDFDWIALHFCGSNSVGRYTARGGGYLVDRETNLMWMAGVGHTGLRILPRGPLMFELSVEGYLNIMRPSLVVEGAIHDPLHMPVWAAATNIEVLAAF